ncbi:MAG: Uma2 family endonuclease [Xenococcaceae cyanobacterium MO_234.B1]|nr:Uma2 family endonuclease [Xenococcaceae cyanobacterium MO_234.B1]
MVKSLIQALTLAEFLELPETKPIQEYINGQIINKPMPRGKHSIIQGSLVAAINNAIRPQKIGLALPELRCTFGNRSIVPDIVIFSWSRIPVDNNGDIANIFDSYPDWTIEILSPGQNQTLVTGNILHCLNHGSSCGWLIDPESRSVLVYPSNKQPELLQSESDIITVPDIFNDFKLTIGELFSWLKI